MLVVSRRPGERLLIGESVEVTVLSVHGDQVSLGVSAPRAVPIHRQELFDRIRRENQRATSLRAEELQALSASVRAHLSHLSPEAKASANPEPATEVLPAAAADGAD